MASLIKKAKDKAKDKTGSSKVKKKAKAKTTAEKVTEKGRPLIATTTAPAAAVQDAAPDMTDDTGVFGTGPGDAPQYHYHVDTQTYPEQVAAQMAEAQS